MISLCQGPDFPPSATVAPEPAVQSNESVSPSSDYQIIDLNNLTEIMRDADHAFSQLLENVPLYSNLYREINELYEKFCELRRSTRDDAVMLSALLKSLRVLLTMENNSSGSLSKRVQQLVKIIEEKTQHIREHGKGTVISDLDVLFKKLSSLAAKLTQAEANSTAVARQEEAREKKLSRWANWTGSITLAFAAITFLTPVGWAVCTGFGLTAVASGAARLVIGSYYSDIISGHQRDAAAYRTAAGIARSPGFAGARTITEIWTILRQKLLALKEGLDQAWKMDDEDSEVVDALVKPLLPEYDDLIQKLQLYSEGVRFCSHHKVAN